MFGCISQRTHFPYTFGKRSLLRQPTCYKTCDASVERLKPINAEQDRTYILASLLTDLGENLLKLAGMGRKLVLVPNQSGIARGFFGLGDKDSDLEFGMAFGAKLCVHNVEELMRIINSREKE